MYVLCSAIAIIKAMIFATGSFLPFLFKHGHLILLLMIKLQTAFWNTAISRCCNMCLVPALV